MNNSKILQNLCKEVISEMAEKGFLKKNLSKEQLEKLERIKKSHKE